MVELQLRERERSSPRRAPENQHDPHNRDRPPKNELQLGSLDDLLNSLDHGDQLLQREEDVDDATP